MRRLLLTDPKTRCIFRWTHARFELCGVAMLLVARDGRYVFLNLIRNVAIGCQSTILVTCAVF